MKSKHFLILRLFCFNNFLVVFVCLYLNVIHLNGKVYSATFRPCPERQVAIKRVELLEMVDSKARADCVKEVQLLKVRKHFSF